MEDKQIPDKNWISKIAQILSFNKPSALTSDTINFIRLSTHQQADNTIKKAKINATIPIIKPWIKNGPRANQFEAPTSRIVDISSPEPAIAIFMVLKTTKAAIKP